MQETTPNNSQNKPVKSAIITDLSALDALPYTTCGLLPVADKPRIHYILDHLSQQGIQTATIVTSARAQDYAKELNAENLWGVQLDYVENASTLDALRLSNNATAIYCMSQPLAKLLQENPAQQNDTMLSTLSMADYFDDNIYVLSNHEQLVLRGYENQSGIYQDASSSADITQAPAYLGRNSSVANSCTNGSHIIIGKNSRVDQNVALEQTIVLPNCYVGPHLDISNCLISDRWIYNRLTDGLIEIDDPQLVAMA